MKKSTLITTVILALLLVLNVFLLSFYYREIAYPIEDPAEYIASEEDLKDASVLKDFSDEYPIRSSDYRCYLLEKADGSQKLILFCKFRYMDQYQVVWETDVPSERPCTVTIDFYGKSSDFVLDETQTFQKQTFPGPGAFLNIAPNDLMLMPVIGWVVFGAEAAIAYGVYALIRKKKAKTAA